ncbi:hypothetical protein LCGC14_0195220 [marine sediment metagenome]|uniref:Uncharacterized protein n=1 Tax=marine sediment metagenome TaxID=412755 RepID=A0A0F9UPX0_9ZZZZ
MDQLHPVTEINLINEDIIKPRYHIGTSLICPVVKSIHKKDRKYSRAATVGLTNIPIRAFLLNKIKEERIGSECDCLELIKSFLST